MKTKPVIFGGIAVSVLIVMSWANIGISQIGLPAGSLLPYKDPVVVAKGEVIYSENCASCHGDNLKGEPDWQTPKESGRMPAPPHDETGHTWHHRDELLMTITKLGLAKLINKPDYQTDMPIYDGILEDHEIIAALAYIKSRWPGEIQTRHDEMNSQPK
ncbi:c-type cytochrome [Maritalea sp.]|uniref:c-type cytochrome n=1 Tax=Maritalea sp. TaxID=2003361 RepID=UPI0039E5C8EF